MGFRSALVGGMSAAIVLTACGVAQDGFSTPSCEEVACTGVLNGAAYEILLPEEWNGTLVLYSHGYRSAQPVPPNFEPVSTQPEPAPGWASGNTQVGQALLDQGFALAGSAFASNGWAVADGVTAGADLIDFFTEEIAEPQRVLAWGDSLGGLITAVLAQQNPNIDGALPMCGALAGANPNLDLGLTVAWLLKSLVWEDLPIDNFGGYEEALAAAIAAAQLIFQLAGSTEDGLPDLADAMSDQSLFGELGSLGDTGAPLVDLPVLDPPVVDADPDLVLAMGEAVDAPTVTERFDGGDRESRVLAVSEGLITAVTFGLLARYEIIDRVGGDPSRTLNVPLLDGVPGYTPDPEAREQAASLGDVTGEILQPTITLHTAFDSITIAPNVTWFADLVVAQGRQDDLLTLFTTPPATFPVDPGAPFGAGHCNFTPESRLAALGLLDQWVESGERPTEAQVQGALGADSGYTPGFDPGPWPQG
jgi:hypothetical protein